MLQHEFFMIRCTKNVSSKSGEKTRNKKIVFFQLRQNER